MDSLKQPPDSSPEDIQQGWLDFSRKMQAACKGNNGFARLTVTVAVNKSNAEAWLPPIIEKIDPVRLSSEIDMTPAAYQTIFTLMQNSNGANS